MTSQPSPFASPILQFLNSSNPTHTGTEPPAVAIAEQQVTTVNGVAVLTSVQPSQSRDTNPKRAVQLVLTNTQCCAIVKWMVNTATVDGEDSLCAKTVRNFPQYFRGNTKANLQRASRYWKARHSITQRHIPRSKNNGHCFVRATAAGLKKHLVKAAPGRGRKKTAWSLALSTVLLEEFDSLRKAGVKMNCRLLETLAKSLIREDSTGLFATYVLDPNSGKPIIEHINRRWVQHFMQGNNIVSRSQTGKLLVSPAKRELIEREVAFYLGTLCREMRSGVLKEENIFNADETHFVIDTHDHKTLARRGHSEVKFADVVSGDEGITMMVTIEGGKQANLGVPLLIFKNADGNYPIRNLRDNIPGVCYRTGPKAWMDSRVFHEWIKEKKVLSTLPNERKRVLLIDNCSGHAITEEVKATLKRINTEVRFFPANATDLVQPADSFVIQKVKAAWRRKWDEKKLNMTKKKMWVDPRNGSGKLANPGKQYFLQLAKDSVRDVALQKDKQGLSYCRKAMIRCGMALNVNGQWEERQLFPSLQEIIKKYRENFDGAPVGKTKDLDGEATESEEEADS